MTILVANWCRGRIAVEAESAVVDSSIIIRIILLSRRLLGTIARICRRSFSTDLPRPSEHQASPAPLERAS